MMFQIANDVAGLQAAHAPDVEEGKRTIVIVHLLGVLPPGDRSELVRIMGLPRAQRGSREVAWVVARMAEHDSLQYAHACLYGLAGAAMRQAEMAFHAVPPSPARDVLLSVTSYVMEREGLLEQCANRPPA